MSDVVTGADRAVTQPAGRALGYGNTAVNQGVLLAQAPAKKKQPKPPPPKPPQHVLDAEAEWARLFPKSTLMKKVKFHDLATYGQRSGKAGAQAVVNAGFAAWTNSTTEVFVAKAAASSPQELRGYLYHEALHVKQFANANGKPPATYAEMVKFECDAYTESKRWLLDPTQNQQTSVVTQLAAGMGRIAGDMCRAKKRIGRPTNKQREVIYKKFLVDNGYLPKHGSISDLYEP